jgi:orotate phosphoribosyltransferase
MLSAAQELTREHGLPVLSIAGLREIMDYASSQPELAAISDELATYRAQYGVD